MGKVQVATVDLKELGDDLSFGVPYRTMTEMNLKVFPRHSPIHFDGSDKVRSFQNTHIVSIESIIPYDNLENVFDGWLPVYCCGVKILENLPVQISDAYVSGKELYKCLQSYAVEFVDSDARYIEFYCNVRHLKFGNTFFRKGDMITVMLEKEKDVPPVITISPNFETQYIPLLPGQTIATVSSGTDVDVRYHYHDKSVLYYSHRQPIRHRKDRYLQDNNVFFDFFPCYDNPVQDEYIFFNFTKSNLWRSVIIPTTKWKGSEYPVLVDPKHGSVIYAYNIEGFIFRSHQVVPLIPRCHSLDTIYIAYQKDYCETKIRLNRGHSHVLYVFEQHENCWLVKEI